MNHVIDATGERVGRIASKIAVILQGKLHPSYERRISGTDHVTVKNAAKVFFSGSKLETKDYKRHTGYMGHLRKKPMKIVFKESPEEVIRRAVYNMLPKNRLRTGRLKRLVIER
ncbi:MAG: 50S ribosomal protein L13 [Patescibacteria group bacterium]